MHPNSVTCGKSEDSQNLEKSQSSTKDFSKSFHSFKRHKQKLVVERYAGLGSL